MVVGLPFSDRNLILTGYTGPNQPRLGVQIAERLRMPYVNLDTQLSERMGMSVDEIRQSFGESRLKSIEMDMVDEACLRRSTLIRISSRTLLTGTSLARLSETGPIVCLVTTLDAMLQRLHMAMGARYYNPEERAVELGMLRREWAVRGLSGVIEIDTTYLDNETIIEQVAAQWQERAVTRV